MDGRERKGRGHGRQVLGWGGRRGEAVAEGDAGGGRDSGEGVWRGRVDFCEIDYVTRLLENSRRGRGSVIL